MFYLLFRGRYLVIWIVYMILFDFKRLFDFGVVRRNFVDKVGLSLV